MKHPILVFLALVIASFATPSMAVIPESGLYWNGDTSGLGWYVEVQGDTVVMLAYAHDIDTEKPLFYLAAGKIVADESSERTYKFQGSMYVFERGPCITCFWGNWDTSEYAQKAGDVTLYLLGRNMVSMELTMTNGNTKQVVLRRFKFGREVYNLRYAATDTIKDQYFSDLRGTWVFVDIDDASQPVWRFDFDEVHYPADYFGTLLGNEYPHGIETLQFVDPQSNATLICAFYACELRQGDEMLMVIDYDDLGQDSLFGTQDLPKEGETYSDSDQIVGLRVPDPTPDLSPPGAEQ